MTSSVNGKEEINAGDGHSIIARDAYGHRFQRHELARLAAQMLYELGFSSSAKTLETEARVEVVPAQTRLLTQDVLCGRWENVLRQLRGEDGSVRFRTSEGGSLAQYLVLQQMYAEKVVLGDIEEALSYLDSRIEPFIFKHFGGSEWTDVIRKLSCLLLCADDASLWAYHQAVCKRVFSTPAFASMAMAIPPSHNKDDAQRKAILHNLSVLMSHELMLPRGRMMTLLGQAVERQAMHARVSLPTVSFPDSLTLYEDISESLREQATLPNATTQIAHAHLDEVWCVAFSHSGHMLASGSKDKTIVLWNVDMVGSSEQQPPRKYSRLSLKFKFTEAVHGCAVSRVTWSPDDSQLLSCGVSSTEIKLWDVESSALVRSFEGHEQPISALAWTRDGSYFVSGGFDKSIFLWHKNGARIIVRANIRVYDLAVSCDNAYIIAASTCSKIRFFQLSDISGILASMACTERAEDVQDRFDELAGASGIVSLQENAEREIAESNSVVAMSLSSDGKVAVASVRGKGMEAWDIATGDNLYSFSGIVHGRYVIRSSFGGLGEQFLVSGGDSGNVHIWDRQGGEPIACLPGHAATVNAAVFNPADPTMIVSASDDHTLRVWSHVPESQLANLVVEEDENGSDGVSRLALVSMQHEHQHAVIEHSCILQSDSNDSGDDDEDGDSD